MNEVVFPQEGKLLKARGLQLVSLISAAQEENIYVELYGDFIRELDASCILVTQPELVELEEASKLELSGEREVISKLEEVVAQYEEAVDSNIQKIERLRGYNLFLQSSLIAPWAEYAEVDLVQFLPIKIEHIDGESIEELDLLDGDLYVYEHTECIQEMNNMNVLESYCIYSEAKHFSNLKDAVKYELAASTAGQKLEQPLEELNSFSFEDLINFRLEIIEELQRIYKVNYSWADSGNSYEELVELNEFINRYVETAEEELLEKRLRQYFRCECRITEFDLRETITLLETHYEEALLREEMLWWQKIGLQVQMLRKEVEQLEGENKQISIDNEANTERLQKFSVEQQKQSEEIYQKLEDFEQLFAYEDEEIAKLQE